MKAFREGDLLTYRVKTKYGIFELLRSSENNLIHLYRKIYQTETPIVPNNICYGILRLSHFVGFESLEKKRPFKYSRSLCYYLYDDFYASFPADCKNKALAFFFECDDIENNQRKLALENWRKVYQDYSKLTILENEFDRIKVNYYEFKLPILSKVEVKDNEVECTKCIGYGVIPFFFGINFKTGSCYKCSGKGVLFSKLKVMAISLKELGVVKSLTEGKDLVIKRFNEAFTMDYFEDWNGVVNGSVENEIINNTKMNIASNNKYKIDHLNFLYNRLFQILFISIIPRK